MYRNFFEINLKIFFLLVVISDNRSAICARDLRTCDHNRFRTECTKLVDHRMICFLGHTIFLIWKLGQICRLGIVRYDIVRSRNQLTHQINRLLCDSVIELSLISHNRICEDRHAFFRPCLTELGHKLGLLLRHDKSGRDCIEFKSKLFPDSDCIFHVISCIQDVELAIIKCVRYDCCRQVKYLVFHMGKHWNHRG